jgi:hypothetical protein
MALSRHLHPLTRPRYEIRICALMQGLPGIAAVKKEGVVGGRTGSITVSL